MLFTFLLVVHAIIAALLVTIILMQRSEGGGLTTGGNPSGLMSARGAANFLTRGTAILAAMFVGMSILLAVLAATRDDNRIDSSLQRSAPAPAAQTAPAPVTDGNVVVPIVPAAPADNGGVPVQN